MNRFDVIVLGGGPGGCGRGITGKLPRNGVKLR